VCIHTYIPRDPHWPLHYLLSLCNSVHYATSWRVVKSNLLLHLTFISKICLVSVTYLSSTTVMESVATLKCVRNADISHQRCVVMPMLKTYHPPSTMVRCVILQAVCSSANGQSNCPTLDTSHLKMWQNCHSYSAILGQKPREFHARTSKIYEIFFAVT
jgi:hypothetical protein